MMWLLPLKIIHKIKGSLYPGILPHEHLDDDIFKELIGFKSKIWLNCLDFPFNELNSAFSVTIHCSYLSLNFIWKTSLGIE